MGAQSGGRLDQVRIHADAQAAAAAQAVDARAYTVGRRIVFGAGQYAPQSASGRALLAHELAHVAQQRNVNDENLPPHAALSISQPGDAAEVEADRIASGALPVSQATPIDAQIARAPASSAAPPACTGLDRSGIELSVQMAVAATSLTPDSALRWLYRSLKWMRTCFAPFTEKDFQALVPVTKFYPDDRRKEIAKNYSATIAADDRKLAWRESQKPFAGYTVSGYDPSSRFTKPEQMAQAGYSPAAAHQDTETQGFRPSEASARSEELKEMRATSRTAQKPFSQADVLVFSGHQYAQYKAPGVWTDDNTSDPAVFDTRTLKPPLNNVKLIVSTSCATICKEPAAIWKSLFPKAVFLGYRKSAPLNGAVMASNFVSRLPKDMLFESGGQSAAVSAWKGAIKAVHPDDATREPGWMDVAGNTVEYWTGKTFKSVAADSEDNKCKEKGDQSASVPDPGDWRTP
ncbi:MAG: hypothetical protein BroJett021_38210 [Chloroflexota bacterium]|nr:MAG: hypothetical protein BroJett021_38210 [Chloroflexota bacterium]